MLNDSNQETRESVVKTPEQILKQAVLDTKRLDVNPQEVWELRIGPEVKDKLKERARIIVDLPERISKAQVLTGIMLPENVMEDLLSLQEIAQEALKGGHVLEIGSILEDKGSKVGEANRLEEIVNRLYPQKR